MRAPTALAAIAVLVAAVSLAGCAGQGTERGAVTPTTTPTQTSSSSASPSDLTDELVAAPAAFANEVTEAFGIDRAQAAYDTLVEFTDRFGCDPELVVPNGSYSAEDFAPMREYMTPDMQRGFDQSLQTSLTAARGSDDYNAASMNVQNLAYHDIQLDDAEATWATSGPLVVNRTIEARSTGVEASLGKSRLEIKVTSGCDLRSETAGQVKRTPFTRTTTYWLEPASGGSGKPWLIDGYEGRIDIGDGVPEDAS